MLILLLSTIYLKKASLKCCVSCYIYNPIICIMFKTQQEVIWCNFRCQLLLILQGACVGSGQVLSEVDVNEETVSELLRCYISATDNNLQEVSHQLLY